MAVSRDDSDNMSTGSFVSQHSDIVSDKKTRELVDGEFQSQEFYTNIDKIKKTGIFVIDIIKSQMTSVEMNYCVARASTLFIQGTHTAATSLLVNTFQGNKLVFCGGNLNHQDGRDHGWQRDIRRRVHNQGTRCDLFSHSDQQ